MWIRDIRVQNQTRRPARMVSRLESEVVRLPEARRGASLAARSGVSNLNFSEWVKGRSECSKCIDSQVPFLLS
ncbi:hypothetical protein SXCC_03501 [Gluconacetobacter sp. SXCC-1]|nr:hypothetical protein SXCC_03501 [Gluconacetobacter sp. SXCC-1]